MKKIISICFLGCFLINFFSSCHRDDKSRLEYKFKQNKVIKTDNRFSMKFDINRIDIMRKNLEPSDNDLQVFQKDSIISGIREILLKDDLKTLEIDLSTILTEVIIRSMIDSAHISRVSEFKSLSIKADGEEIRTEESFLNFIKVILSENQDRKRLSSGEWYDLPRIMGINLSGAGNDPYIGRLLLFMRNGFAFPGKAIDVGYKWDSNLSISIPVDSLSKGQSRGFIDIDIINNQELVKKEKNIAEIKMDLRFLVKWDVNVPEEGYSRFELSLGGSGYRLFNIRKCWNYGMFLKGDSKIMINSETKDKVDPNKQIPLIIDATGIFEIGSKVRQPKMRYPEKEVRFFN